MEQKQKERSIKELLELLYQEVENNGVEYGLCISIRDMEDINNGECTKLSDYVRANRPHMFSSISAFRMSNSVYYWPIGKTAPRLKWLKKHIKLNSVQHV